MVFLMMKVLVVWVMVSGVFMLVMRLVRCVGRIVSVFLW